MNKLLIVTILVIIFFAIHFKQKVNIKKNIVFLSEKISLWMQTFYFYHAIYCELKKINNFFLMKFLWNSNRKCNNILKHLQDIHTIFDKLQQDQKITDIEIMMLLTYDQSVTFLKQKYGLVSGSYFMDASFTQTNPNIKKTAEGLEIHHIKEYQARGLSNSQIRQTPPF
ncbi:hypothetical protein HPP_4130 [Hydrangea phyllody phytoplasma]|uniref:Sequence-variable mosaic (SVM) signal sequence domain-containing protein n=2 Tax=16SrI (Aster yellows group) TaxID=3042590 RepID=A0ABQ5PST8_9MOLU|nr:hypothetical protein [Hydrangea phyllody phytoplasma]GFZ75455.1 hypothetical protein HPP_4130 [Hydrangea phyllody phytoplasma]GLH61576.1 hypothetical protein RHYP_5220 [Rhus yellows phytoplasma]GLH61921.1 hypothetical protein HP2P_3280 [Hydrangea phyllody phytoplasma]